MEVENKHTGVAVGMITDDWISWGRWLELSCSVLGGVDLAVDDEAAFRMRFRHHARSKISVSEFTNTPHFVERTVHSVREVPSEMIGIAMLDAGQVTLEAGGQEVSISPGDMYLHDLQRPFRSIGIGSEETKWRIVHINRSGVADSLDTISSVEELKFNGATAETKAFRAYLSGFIDNFLELSEAGVTALGGTASAMLKSLLLLQRPHEMSKQSRDLARVQAALMERMNEPTHSLKAVAEELGIGPRTIHRLFHSIGTTPARWLEGQRLAAVAQELRGSATSGRLITSIARAYGYSDPAHLSRNFKKQFGMSPKEYRKTANQ